MTNQPGTVAHLLRTLGYALTSIFVMYTGYCMQASVKFSMDLLLAIVPIALSLSFFLAYAICFHYDSPEKIRDAEILCQQQKDAHIIIISLNIILPIIVVLAYKACENKFPPIRFMASSCLYGLIFIGYAFLLSRYRKDNKSFNIRHRLVWPVVLSIGASLYMGLFFNKLGTTLIPIVPLLILLAYFVISEKYITSGKVFLFSGFILMILFATVNLLVDDLLINQCSTAIIFSIAISAYLASFESWRVTSHMAAQIHSGVLQRPTNRINGSPSNYYFATMAAMVIASLITPFVYVFINFGYIFLAGFLLHSIISFSFWYVYGFKETDLRQKNWILYKIIFGFLFLIIMATDSLFQFQPDKNYLPHLASFGSWTFFIIIVTVSTPLFRKRNRSILDDTINIRLKLKRLLKNRDNYLYIIGPLSMSLCFLLLIIQELRPESLADYKIDWAFFTYLIYAGLSLLAMYLSPFVFDTNDKMKLDSIAKMLFGFFLTTRIVTSVLVGLAVFLPSMTMGHNAIESFFSCVPFVLACMGGFALNDYCDCRKDLINYPRRAIPSEKLSPKSVLFLSVSLLLAGTLVSLVQSNGYLELAIYFSAIIGVISYNVVVHKFGYFKNLFTAILCILPIIYDLVIYDFKGIFGLLPISLMFFVFGRELLMDVNDIPGDSQGGFKTLPMIFGERRSSNIGLAMQLIGVSLILPIVVCEPSMSRILVWCLMLLFVTLTCLNWRMFSDIQRLVMIRLMRIPLLFGLLILLG